MYEDIKEGDRRKMVEALTQFIEIHSHNALVSIKLLDQTRMVKEVVGPAFGNFPGAKIRKGPDELTLRV